MKQFFKLKKWSKNGNERVYVKVSTDPEFPIFESCEAGYYDLKNGGNFVVEDDEISESIIKELIIDDYLRSKNDYEKSVNKEFTTKDSVDFLTALKVLAK